MSTPSKYVRLQMYLATILRFVRLQVSNLSADLGFLRLRPTRLPLLRQCDTDGFSILVNVNEDVGRSIYLNRDFEREEVRFLEKNVRPNDICFDIGANVGYFSLLMAKLASEGAVYSMEPVPFNFQLLSTNALLNRFTNINPRQMAISDAPGSAEFTVAADGAYSSFLDTKRKPVQSRILVETVSIDAFCDRNAIPRIDCVKVDVEGAEAKVIAGARRTLSNIETRPRFIIMELYNPMLVQYGSDIQSIVKSLGEFGYQPFVERDGQLSPLATSDYDILYNVFFISDSKAS